MSDLVVFGVDPETSKQIVGTVQNVMKPQVMPDSIHIVPHQQYLAAQKAYSVHVPKGKGNHMFTHLPSGRIFIDASAVTPGDSAFYEWLGHEFGHLDSNSVDESAAEREQSKYAKRLASSREQQREGDYIKQVQDKGMYQFLANPRGESDAAYLSNPDHEPYQSLAGK